MHDYPGGELMKIGKGMETLEDRILRIFSGPIKREEGGPTDEWIVSGVASVSGFKEDGLLIPMEVFATARDEFMRTPNFMLSHNEYNARDLVGLITDLDPKDDGLHFRAMVSKGEPAVWQKVLETVYRCVSINVRIMDGAWSESLRAFVATVIRMVEISIVPVPMDPGATFGAARGLVSFLEGVRTPKLAIVPDAQNDPVLEDLLTRESFGALIQSTHAAAQVLKLRNETMQTLISALPGGN